MNLEQIALRVAEETDAYCEAMEQAAAEQECSICDYKVFRDQEYAKALAAALGAQEPVAKVDSNDDAMWAEILPNVNVRVGQLLYAAPPICPTDDYKARALMHEAANMEQAKLLNEVIKERDELLAALEKMIVRFDRFEVPFTLAELRRQVAAIAKSKP